MGFVTRDFDYALPERLIAQTPLPRRDGSRLLVYHRDTGAIEHRFFYEIGAYLRPGDALVINDTRVLPARLLGHAKDTGGKMEFLLLRRVKGDDWEVLVQPGRRAKIGRSFVFGGGLLEGEVVARADDTGARVVRFAYEGIWENVLDRVGQMPLPPYIHEKLKDKERYQTIYAREDGSAAAPTAGLHFTPELLSSLEGQGVEIVRILLHVGLGTFRPVAAERLEEHHMHEEYYEVCEEAARRINAARSRGGRVVAVGTTSVRTLESVSGEEGTIRHQCGETDIFIYPGYRFHAVDALITNFHLPQSTLLMLVSALMGREEALRVYREAIDKEYRFFSFGDAMMIV